MSQVTSDRERMAVEQALETLAAIISDSDVVVTNQIAARLWPHFRNSPLDVNYNPSTMGGAVPFALGLAMAQPSREVIVVSGEGALLMSLGSLVTVVDSQVKNLTVAVLDNAMYEVTGGQRTAATGSETDFAGIARAAGFVNVAQFRTADEWRSQGPQRLAANGPRFISLCVNGCQQPPTPAGPALDVQIEQLQSVLSDDPHNTRDST